MAFVSLSPQTHTPKADTIHHNNLVSKQNYNSLPAYKLPLDNQLLECRNSLSDVFSPAPYIIPDTVVNIQLTQSSPFSFHRPIMRQGGAEWNPVLFPLSCC